MDPNATLTEMRLLARRMIADYADPSSNGIDQDDANRLSELVESMDRWLTRGGFPPTEWNHNPQPSERELIGPLG